MRKLVVAIACLLAFVGCVTTRDVMQSWVGAPESRLVSAWGVPDKVLDTRDGNRMMTWESRWGNRLQFVCRKTFTVDKGGIIRQGSWQNCPQ
jgi:hypothetical protein